MERYVEQKRVVHTIVRNNYTVLQQQSQILGKLTGSASVTFETMFGDCENRIHAIVTFLALLELLNVQRISLTPGLGANNFWVSLSEDWVEEEAMTGEEE
jgi:segregation and condensation protein A